MLQNLLLQKGHIDGSPKKTERKQKKQINTDIQLNPLLHELICLMLNHWNITDRKKVSTFLLLDIFLQWRPLLEASLVCSLHSVDRSHTPDWCRHSTGKRRYPVRHWAHSERTSPLGWGRNHPEALERPELWMEFWIFCVSVSLGTVAISGCNAQHNIVKNMILLFLSWTDSTRVMTGKHILPVATDRW